MYIPYSGKTGKGGGVILLRLVLKGSATSVGQEDSEPHESLTHTKTLLYSMVHLEAHHIQVWLLVLAGATCFVIVFFLHLSQ